MTGTDQTARLRPEADAARRKPLPVGDGEAAALRTLLRIEQDARGVTTEADLGFLIANETRLVVNARQIFVLVRSGTAGFTLKAISSLSSVDAESPMVHWIERIAERVGQHVSANAPTTFTMSEFGDAEDSYTRTYPFPHGFWLPLADRDDVVFGALLLARDTLWDDVSTAVAIRLAGAYSHAWRALVPVGVFRIRMTDRSWIVAGVLCAIAAIGLVPVSLSALAPAEVVPKSPFVMAASIDGVIAAVDVEPNTRVTAGQPLYRFVDTTLRDNLQIAEKAVAVAEAKWKQVAQGAFTDPEAKRELAANEAEYALKKAELTYAADLLSKTVAHAPKDGIVVFNDKRDLVGRPVSTGQRLMEVADPQDVELKINLAVDDSALLREGASARVFLDTDPLRAVEAQIVRASHGAHLIEGNQIAYRADAVFTDEAAQPARIGIRGTAQVFGAKVPLAYLLLRRPLSYLRQHFGL